MLRRHWRGCPGGAPKTWALLENGGGLVRRVSREASQSSPEDGSTPPLSPHAASLVPHPRFAPHEGLLKVEMQEFRCLGFRGSVFLGFRSLLSREEAALLIEVKFASEGAHRSRLASPAAHNKGLGTKKEASAPA